MDTNEFLQATLGGLESGLTVRTITSSPLVTCGPDDDPGGALRRPEWSDYDAIPVQDGSRIVAVIERGTRTKRPLDSSILVSSDLPLERFLATSGLVDDGYRLVLCGSKIDGIVTPSDLLRLPVRVLAFTLIAHLEMTMKQIIDARNLSPNDWLPFLPVPRREELERHMENLQANRLNPDLLEFTYFVDKIKILKGLGFLSNAQAKDADGLNELRNQIAHQRDYANDRAKLRKFLDRIERTRGCIEQLESKLP